MGKGKEEGLISRRQRKIKIRQGEMTVIIMVMTMMSTMMIWMMIKRNKIRRRQIGG